MSIITLTGEATKDSKAISVVASASVNSWSESFLANSTALSTNSSTACATFSSVLIASATI